MIAALVLHSLLAQTFSDRRCQDTWLDGQHPKLNFGADAFMFLGKDAAGLIRFPLIDSMVGHGSKVIGSKIVIKSIDKIPAGCTITAAPVLQSWVEGGGHASDAVEATATKWATWSHASTDPWIATSGQNSFKVSIEGDVITITGIDDLVQKWINDPSLNFGLRLESNVALTLATSESFTAAGPELDVTAEPAPKSPLSIVALEPGSSDWTVTIFNGGEVALPAHVICSNGTKPVEVDIEKVPANGVASTVVHLATDSPVTAHVDTEMLNVDPKGRPVFLTADPASMVGWQELVRQANEWVLPRSRSKNFPAGASTQLRLVSHGADAPVNTPDFKSLFGRVLKDLAPQTPVPQLGQGLVADTRDDSLTDPKVSLSDFGWAVRPELASLVPALGYLSPGEVALLDTAKVPEISKLVFLRFDDGSGKPIKKAQATLHIGDKAVELSGDGGLLLKPDQLPTMANPVMKVDLTSNGVTETNSITIWDLWRETLRGATNVANLERRYMLPSAELDLATDLVKNRIVSDQAKSRPAQLNSVVDGNDDSAFDMDADTGKGWVEIDLAHDHKIGLIEVSFKGIVPNDFDISIDRTGGAEGGAQPWYKETYGQYQANLRGHIVGNVSKLVYCTAGFVGRYVRFTLGKHEKANLAGIKVLSFKDE